MTVSQSFTTLAAISVILLITIQSSMAQSPPRTTAVGQLTPAQLKLLQALGLKIAAPAYIPPGFQLETVQAEVQQHTRVGGMGYTLVYRRYDPNASKTFCFAIEGTNGGIGDIPAGSRSYPVNSPVLGQSTLEYGKYGQASGQTLLSNWLGTERGPFYRFAGVGVSPGLYNCSNVTPQEAVRVTESLRYMTP